MELNDFLSIGRMTPAAIAVQQGCRYERRMETELDIWKKKLLYRATHRGTRELDLIIGGFARARVADFDMAQCLAFETLLEAPETDLSDWLLGQKDVPDAQISALMRDLLAFRPVTSA